MCEAVYQSNELLRQLGRPDVADPQPDRAAAADPDPAHGVQHQRLRHHDDEHGRPGDPRGAHCFDCSLARARLLALVDRLAEHRQGRCLRGRPLGDGPRRMASQGQQPVVHDQRAGHAQVDREARRDLDQIVAAAPGARPTGPRARHPGCRPPGADGGSSAARSPRRRSRRRPAGSPAAGGMWIDRRNGRSAPSAGCPKCRCGSPRGGYTGPAP